MDELKQRVQAVRVVECAIWKVCPLNNLYSGRFKLHAWRGFVFLKHSSRTESFNGQS